MTNTLIKSSMSNKKNRYYIFTYLFLNKFRIIEIIKIFEKYPKRFEIENIAIINKFFIFKRDFLTINNITRLIY